MKIQNAFRVGLLGGLGVLVALMIGGAAVTLSTIITYIGAALFIALGIDPAVSWLERHRFPRWAAIIMVFVAILGVFVGLVFAVIPVIVDQVNNLVSTLPDFIDSTLQGDWVRELQANLPDFIDVQGVLSGAVDWVQSNLETIGGGVLQVGLGIANFGTGLIVIVILALYFVASLNSMKRGIYKLVPATKRAGFADLAEQISQAVGRYVMGQASVAAINGVLAFGFLSLLQIWGGKYPALFAFIGFLFALVPLVGTITGSAIIVLGTLLLGGPLPAIIAAAYYLVYMQVEAYVVTPRVMGRAVEVPGAIVVIAALAGGALLGILGALIAIPVAAAVLLIIDQVVVPRQNEL